MWLLYLNVCIVCSTLRVVKPSLQILSWWSNLQKIPVAMIMDYQHYLDIFTYEIGSSNRIIWDFLAIEDKTCFLTKYLSKG